MLEGGILQRRQITKILAIWIIILFIGVSYSSAIKTEHKLNKVEECNECNQINEKILIKLDKQLSRSEVYSKILLVLGKYNPEINILEWKLLYEISNILHLYNKIILNSIQSDYTITCIKLIVYLHLLTSISNLMVLIANNLPIGSILRINFYNIAGIILYETIPHFNYLGETYDCWWYPYEYVIYDTERNIKIINNQG